MHLLADEMKTTERRDKSVQIQAGCQKQVRKKKELRNRIAARHAAPVPSANPGKAAKCRDRLNEDKRFPSTVL